MLIETQIRKKCERGESHGPYWYLYFRRNGKREAHEPLHRKDDP
jgi:hypothetical protein